MSGLRLYLLGRTLLEGENGVVDPTVYAGRQGAVALTFLADAGRRVERRELARAVWPGEPPEAWDAALSAVISKLRRGLAAAGLDGRHLLPGTQGYCELRLPRGSWIDVRAAMAALDTGEAALSRSEARRAWPATAVATAILSRPLLPGEDGPWLEQRRRELHALHLRALEAMAHAWLLIDNPGAGAVAARQAADLAPLRESSRAVLMRCLIASGDRAEAIVVYRDLQRALREELGISPGAEVEAVYLDALGSNVRAQK